MSVPNIFFRSFSWGLFSELFSFFFGIIGFIVLSIYASENDFAIGALILALISFSNLLSQAGFGQAIIGKQDTSSEFLDTIFISSSVLCMFFYLMITLNIDLISGFYQDSPIVAQLLPFVSLGIFLINFESLYLFIFQKKLQIREMNVLKVFKSFVTLSFLIFFIILDQILYAIIFPGIISSFFSILFSVFITKYFPKLTFNYSLLKKSFNFGISSFFSNIFNFISNNILFVIGINYFQNTFIGGFAFANRINDYYSRFTFGPLTSFIFPILRKLRETDQYKKIILGFTEIQIILFLPIALFFVFNVEYLMEEFYGNKWINALIPLKVFFVIAIFKTLSIPSNSILYAHEKPEISAFISFLRALLFSFFFILIINSKINFNFLIITYGVIDILLILIYKFFSMKIIKLSIIDYLKIFLNNPSIVILTLFYFIFTLIFAVNIYSILASIVIILFFYLFNLKRIRLFFNKPIYSLSNQNE